MSVELSTLHARPALFERAVVALLALLVLLLLGLTGCGRRVARAVAEQGDPEAIPGLIDVGLEGFTPEHHALGARLGEVLEDERIVDQPFVLEHLAEPRAERVVLGREPLQAHVDEPGDGLGIALFRDGASHAAPASRQSQQEQHQEREERHHRPLEERRPRVQGAQLDGHLPLPGPVYLAQATYVRGPSGFHRPDRANAAGRRGIYDSSNSSGGSPDSGRSTSRNPSCPGSPAPGASGSSRRVGPDSTHAATVLPSSGRPRRNAWSACAITASCAPCGSCSRDRSQRGSWCAHTTRSGLRKSLSPEKSQSVVGGAIRTSRSMVGSCAARSATAAPKEYPTAQAASARVDWTSCSTATRRSAASSDTSSMRPSPAACRLRPCEAPTPR